LYVINPVLEDIPDDLISYLLKGRSLYFKINTDYLKFKKESYLSEQDNKDTFCGKSYGGKYNDKGSYVIESKDGKTYKFSKIESVEKKGYKYGIFYNDGNSKTKFYYKCDGDVFFIEGGKREKLSEKLNKISSNEAAADNPCLEKGNRLYRVNEKVVKGVFNLNNIRVKKHQKYQCTLNFNYSYRGIDNTIGFAEKPNYYNIVIKGTDFIIGVNTFLYNIIKNYCDEDYKNLLNYKFIKFIIMGDYSLNENGVVGLYNFSIEKVINSEGKEFSFKKDVEINAESKPQIFKQIIESFEAADGCLRYWEYIVFKTRRINMSTKELSVKVVNRR
jgi:hypothetical protein